MITATICIAQWILSVLPWSCPCPWAAHSPAVSQEYLVDYILLTTDSFCLFLAHLKETRHIDHRPKSPKSHPAHACHRDLTCSQAPTGVPSQPAQRHPLPDHTRRVCARGGGAAPFLCRQVCIDRWPMSVCVARDSTRLGSPGRRSDGGSGGRPDASGSRRRPPTALPDRCVPQTDRQTCTHCTYICGLKNAVMPDVDRRIALDKSN